MGKRRADADGRRFFDEFEKVNVSRFRATGVIDPAKSEALIPFPNDKTKLIGTQHVKFWNGGGYSYFVCPGCNRRARKLYLLDDAARCTKCCIAMNIRYRTEYGFGLNERRKASDKALDELIAKLSTTTPLRFKPNTWNWGGRAQTVYNTRKLTEDRQRRLISLRLKQLAYQDLNPKSRNALVPRADARSLLNLEPIWQAKSREDLEQALDKAQIQIIAALESDDPQMRMAAVRLMMRTKQARERGISG